MRHLPPAAAEASPPPHPTARALGPIAAAFAQIPPVAMAARAQAWQFAAALVFFHGSEYVLAAAFHGRHNVTATSLLISKQYVLAMSFAMLEHLTEAILFPGLKEYQFVSHVGLLMVIVGEVIRKLAVVTAGRSFTHVIRIHYEDQHHLITHGVYSRNPGYVVQSSIHSCIHIGVVEILFKTDTTRYEEFFLRQFFGREYEDYAQKH
uniref:Protein-S-isoprenylcysteine O-methyltransferase n=1 Tax=Leersia perrieri TaxID=77586 RepID=A0A0D9W916_9ORYZ